MRFRLTPKSMTLDDLDLTCYKFEFSRNFAGFSQVWEPTTAKRMKIDLHTVSDAVAAH